jgi:glucosamine--fructose-6-phosphate aminotransferase (isomerizing)
MLKEMFEQPGSVEATLNQRTTPEGQIKLDGVKFTKKELDGINRIYIVACGTAYHAGVVGKNIIEKYAKIPVEVEVASEFRYKDPFVDEKTLIIAISQSGETSDTLEGMREARRRGARILSVVNVVGSSVARESDDVLYTWAGPEIAVASTKAYITQLVCMYLIALFMGQTKGLISQEKAKDVIGELKLIPGKISEILADEASYISLAKSLYKKEQVFFIGRGMDVATSLEGSLKLKEISYINSFAIQAGELKHGTIALINRGTLFFALATQDYVHDKMISNIEEIRARKAYVVAFSKKGDSGIENVSDVVCYIPSTSDELAPLLSIIPLQLLAYHIAKLRGREIDKPRNLAKSVTVE